MTRSGWRNLLCRAALAVALTLTLTLPVAARAELGDAHTLLVAVAANFADTLGALARRYRETTGVTVEITRGATGMLFAQIVQGAPYDLFFAADRERPLRLEQQGLAAAGSRATYALGVLALWSPDPQLVDAQGEVLASDRFRHLALANPDLAPYGQAAVEVLRGNGRFEQLDAAGRLVFGASVAQAQQFAATGNAQLAFVSLAQVRDAAGSRWLPPPTLYQPIAQQAVIVATSPRTESARHFLDWVLQDAEARALIQRAGYELP